MACRFPTKVTSLKKWLKELKLERYEQTLASVPLHELPKLTHERLIELGVSNGGHRKRLLIAAEKICDVTPSYASSQTKYPMTTVTSGTGGGGDDDEQIKRSDHVAVQTVDVAVQQRLIRRMLPAIIILMMSCIAIIAFIPDGKAMPYLATLWATASTGIAASFWPSDTDMQTGSGRLGFSMVYLSMMLASMQVVREVWPLAPLYPLPAQGVLHRAVCTRMGAHRDDGAVPGRPHPGRRRPAWAEVHAAFGRHVRVLSA